MKLRRSLTLILSINTMLILLVLVVSYTLWIKENYFIALDTGLTFNMMSAEKLIDKKGFDAVKPYLEIIEAKVIKDYQQLPSKIKQQYSMADLIQGKYVNSEMTMQLILQSLGFDTLKGNDSGSDYYVYTAQKNGTQIYYLMVEFNPEISGYWQDAEYQLNQVWKVSFTVVLLLLLTLLTIVWHIAKPIRRLNHWAQHLSRKDLDSPLPSFEYRELDSLAAKIHHSLQEVDAISQRETQFLQYASHELRTPISIIKSNTELLEQLLPDVPAATKAVLQRLLRAGNTMHHLTETLLWLTRKEISIPSSSQFSLTQLLTDTVDEHRYLLIGKNIRIEQTLAQVRINCPITLINIVLANLIRNAMQHIDEGEILINLNDSKLIIENRGELLDKDKTDGFGLGLKLVKQICQQLDWKFVMNASPNCCIATIEFISNRDALNVNMRDLEKER